MTQHESSSIGELEARLLVSYRKSGLCRRVTANDASFSFNRAFASSCERSVRVLVLVPPVLRSGHSIQPVHNDEERPSERCSLLDDGNRKAAGTVSLDGAR